MNFNEYQKEAEKTFVNNQNTPTEILSRLALGLSGEAGEVAEKVKKLLRGDYGYNISKFNIEVEKELGDVLWYLAVLAKKLSICKYNLNDIAINNIEKLKSRKERSKIKGNGDNR